MEIRISGLFFYPIKSCAGTAAAEAVLEARGIRHDRRWMVVDAADRMFLTQREHERMALIAPSVSESALTVTAPGLPPLEIPLQREEEPAAVPVTVWRDTCLAQDEGETAADWLSTFLGFSCRLVKMAPGFRRQVDPEYARPGDVVGFADGFPLLLASEASLADLNARMAEPIGIERFRPNLIVRGAPAFAEDTWRRLTVPAAGVSFRVAKPCARCAVPTIDQHTGKKAGPEPLAALSTFRRTPEGKVLFGQNLIHDWHGQPLALHIGDVIQITCLD